MQALRTLPILNRPSRPASPAPSTPQISTTTATGSTTQPSGPTANGYAVGMTQTASEPGKPRSRSLSRQITDKVSQLHLQGSHPAPIGTNGTTTVHRSQPLGKKGASPPGSRPATPRIAPNPAVAGAPAGEMAAPQGGYMEGLGLRLNESVNKACAGVDFKAKKGFKQGAGWSVGEAVVKELPYPPSDAYLIRAVLRTSIRSLSIYTTRLESLLLPSLTDPSFPTPLNLTAHNPATAHPLNPAQHFAVTVAHAAWETCEVLEQTLETGKWPKFVSEALRPVMDKLDLVVGKVIQPLLLGLKRDLVASVARTEGTSPAGGKVAGLNSVPLPASAAAPPTASTGRLVKEPSQPGSARTLPIPTSLQHFASRVDMARKVLEIVARPCMEDGEGWTVGVVVAVVWKGMCVIAEKELLASSTSAPAAAAAAAAGARAPSPGQVSKALNDIKLSDSKEKTQPAVVASPGLGGVTAKLTSVLPSRAVSRPPSPPRRAPPLEVSTRSILSLQALVSRLVKDLVHPPNPAQASDPNAVTEHLAREALSEALEAMQSFKVVLSAMTGKNGLERLLSAARRMRDDVDDPKEEELDDALEDLPEVLLYNVLWRRANAALAELPPPQSQTEKSVESLKLRSPAEIWGWTTADFERQVLAGFGVAEEWGGKVMLALKAEVERVMRALSVEVAKTKENRGRLVDGAGGVRAVEEAEGWVRVLGLMGEGVSGVRCVGCV